jgi:hypothetical protein
MSNLIDLTNKTFYHWKVIRKDKIRGGQLYWLCKCSCGAEKLVRGYRLSIGETKSCGCATKDLTGKKFGHLTALNRFYKNKIPYWTCLCECGQSLNVKSNDLKSGHKLSCGCLDKDKPKRIREKKFWGAAQAKSSYKHSAKKTGKEFTLTDEQIDHFLSGNCFYCGSPPSMSNGDGSFRNGIDRVNNSFGYTLENCVSCCPTCNYSKRKMSPSAFFDWISRTYTHLKHFGYIKS